MRVTTLGTGTVALAPGRARAGLLVEAGPVRMLLDCGSGITQRLADHGVDWMGITHVALTHFHTDHFGDLPTLVFAWKYGALPARAASVDVYGPPGTAALLGRLADAFGEWLREPGFPLRVEEIAPGGAVLLPGEVRLSARKVPHTDESVAYSVEYGRRRVVYTGDTGYDPGLAEWAGACDLLVCECSLPRAMAVPIHLTPEECGTIAAAARPGHLALTHFYPPVEQVDVRAIVAGQFAGLVTLAYDGWYIELGDT
ncbi:MAG: MBL fold metallo-hydrolase [Gemmatimonadaceae bacterium]